MRLWPLAFLLLLVACDEVVSERQTAAPYTREEETRCYTMGLCYKGEFDGRHTHYWFGFHYQCPGLRRILVQYTPMEYTYESGKTKLVERRRTLRNLGECKL